ncbi:hypothetical protein [Kitasatospora sp. McL0602]|uniref:hypothetical protein n=1 Tax=Kitasatospora sp. McL0602 TaxID=3439530 RepID=UPI003F8B10ED
MELEDRLGEMFEETVRVLPVPVAVMVAEATRRGRRRRVVRRAGQLAGAALATAGLVWGSAALDLRTGPAAPASRPADVTEEHLVGTLAALLPAGATLRQVAAPHDPAARAAVTLTYDDGSGPVPLTVTLRWTEPSDPTGQQQTGYLVQARQPTGTDLVLAVGPGTALSLTDWQTIARSPLWDE